MYFSEEMRSKKIGTATLEYTFFRNFKITNPPLDYIAFTWRPANTKIEHILLKLGVKYDELKNYGEYGEWVLGHLTREEYLDIINKKEMEPITHMREHITNNKNQLTSLGNTKVNNDIVDKI